MPPASPSTATTRQITRRRPPRRSRAARRTAWSGPAGRPRRPGSARRGRPDRRLAGLPPPPGRHHRRARHVRHPPSLPGRPRPAKPTQAETGELITYPARLPDPGHPSAGPAQASGNASDSDPQPDTRREAHRASSTITTRPDSAASGNSGVVQAAFGPEAGSRSATEAGPQPVRKYPPICTHAGWVPAKAFVLPQWVGILRVRGTALSQPGVVRAVGQHLPGRGAAREGARSMRLS